jgi:hypothetical protein
MTTSTRASSDKRTIGNVFHNSSHWNSSHKALGHTENSQANVLGLGEFGCHVARFDGLPDGNSDSGTIDYAIHGT